MNPGLFETFYNGPVQHPGLLWVSNLVGTTLALLALRSRTGTGASRLRRFILFWALVSVLDAWLSANRVFGMGTLSAPWSSVVPFLFVWMGDFRIFLGMELFGAGFPDQPVRLQWWRPLLACFVVPVLAGLLTRGLDSRILFLVYEALFLAMITGYGRFTGTSRSPAARGIRNLSWVFYSLWVSADVAILVLPEGLRDIGFAARILPNLIYYGGFGWVCARVGRRNN
jgi:hypothetical protein